MKTCAVVLVVVVLLGAAGNPVSGWVTWYASTHHRQELKTTPPQDSNDVSSHLATPRNTAELPAELDLLKLLNVSGATPGVSEVLGPTERLPAYKFRPGYSNVLVPAPAAIAAALTAPAGFTVIFVYRQHRKTLGTLVSVHSPGRVTPWFQITSNLRTGQLVLHYRVTSDSKLHQNSWALLPPQQAVIRSNPSSQTETKRANGWTHLGLVYNASSGLLTLYLDCGPPREQPLAGAALHVPEEALVYFRQEPGFKKKFLGSMQIAKIIPRPLSRKQLGWTCGPAP